ncbi:MAG: zinc ribbon domain-containing protein [Verrucomicrobia bacterium]|nr:zinc ribbon domain-containing protein [Verrucomicrobiota bacterium]MBV9298276.1 zinc ribbon domain-containing protein [Verrucomicrobiota bacterium]
MTYVYDFEDGQRLIVENDGSDTFVALSSEDEGQEQSQSTAFNTGSWLKAPELFRTRGGLMLRIESKNAVEFIRVRGNQIQLLRSEQELENVERLKLKQSDESIAIKPMEPMKPIGRMRPMEMRMGGMHMSMGASEKEAQTEKRFCTQCGKPVQNEDRFCASCGHALSGQR